jgi:hypothetical protein
VILLGLALILERPGQPKNLELKPHGTMTFDLLLGAD